MKITLDLEFPVVLVGVDKVHGAFLIEGPTRGGVLCSVQEIRLTFACYPAHMFDPAAGNTSALLITEQVLVFAVFVGSVAALPAFIEFITEVRKRLSCGSAEVQTSQSQAITGTPCEVPVPKKVTVKILLSFVSVGVKKQPVSHQTGHNPFQGYAQAQQWLIF